ncbi:LPXTG cell wall anchor domain-containing protein [Propioniciclava sp.]|uniref:LPXTG cell wall anchor domain-containing protein n=1 Tax=Propioniciclava sp. TaxID=2038686 RepID=UPI002624F046|nr:LPXTG cell wall anchor domain-containing protein [Propioniciclava sp.]
MTVSRKLIAGLGAIALGAAVVVSMPGAAQADSNDHKVWVCKYVGKPGVNETLKRGKNPILVDYNATGMDQPTVGAWFNDAQGRSYVVALGTDPEPSVDQCPVPTPTPTPTPPTPPVTTPPVTTPPVPPGTRPPATPATTSRPSTPSRPTTPPRPTTTVTTSTSPRGVPAKTGDESDPTGLAAVGALGLAVSAGALAVARRRR